MNYSPSAPPDDETFESRRYIVVRFGNDVDLPSGPFKYDDIAHLLPPGAAPIDNEFQFEAHFSATTARGLQKHIRRARDSNPDYRPPNFENYSRIHIADEAQADALLGRLRTWNITEYAYLHPGAVEPPMSGSPEPLQNEQIYLHPEPMGIDAIYAWEEPGGKGEGQRLADVEWGWGLAHTDLAKHKYTNLNDGFYKQRPHGTGVLGIIAAHRNDAYCAGIAHGLDHIVTVGQWLSAKDCVTAPAVADALAELDDGDVLLLEAQTTMYGYTKIPVEAEPDVYEVVELATEGGVTVVAAAGNGAVLLDEVTDEEDLPVFSRDSGAIIVAAATLESAPKWEREEDSCFGQRIDCFAQGTRAVTLSTNYWGTANYISKDFDGTSAASAIIAGAALVVQGVALKKLGNKLKPEDLRKALKNPELNTPPNSTTAGIGYMPNLRAIINDL